MKYWIAHVNRIVSLQFKSDWKTPQLRMNLKLLLNLSSVFLRDYLWEMFVWYVPHIDIKLTQEYRLVQCVHSGRGSEIRDILLRNPVNISQEITQPFWTTLHSHSIITVCIVGNVVFRSHPLFFLDHKIHETNFRFWRHSCRCWGIMGNNVFLCQITSCLYTDHSIKWQQMF